MKNLKIYFVALFFIAGIFRLSAQSDEESTGMLGDNFSLEGALDVFKNASSVEEFEELLNQEDNSINNLDLNDDGNIDYVRVEDNMSDNVHAIVLQAVISENESQDIAVIEIERTGDESATLQIVGDEYLYGEDVYVEPFEIEGSSDGKGGPSTEYYMSRIVINVWTWPTVRFIYRPNYVVYRSPFRWNHYPRRWKPWRPVTWNMYHGKRRHYHVNYHRVNTHRVVKARKIYTPKRRTSQVVVRKSKTVSRVGTNKRGNTVVKRNTTTTKVKKNNKGKTQVKKTKKSTKVKQGRKGKKVTKTKKVKKKSGN